MHTLLLPSPHGLGWARAIEVPWILNCLSFAVNAFLAGLRKCEECRSYCPVLGWNRLSLLPAVGTVRSDTWRIDWCFRTIQPSLIKRSLTTLFISKVLHTALARPVWWRYRTDFRDSLWARGFSKERSLRIGRSRGPRSAKRSLEMEEETDWGQISCRDQRSYINARPQVQYRKFGKSMDCKCFPNRSTVLTRAHQPLTCSQNWINHSVGNASEALRRCLMRWPE